MGKLVSFKLPEGEEEVWADFLAYIARKYGSVKGRVGREVALALREYLERRGFRPAASGRAGAEEAPHGPPKSLVTTSSRRLPP